MPRSAPLAGTNKKEPGFSPVTPCPIPPIGGCIAAKLLAFRPWVHLGRGPSRTDFSLSMLHYNAGHVRTLFSHGGLGYLNDALNRTAPERTAYMLAVVKVFNLVDQGAHAEKLVRCERARN